MLPARDDNLRDFCQRAFTSLGGLVEVRNDGMMEVLIGDRLADNFAGRSYLNLVFDRPFLSQYPEAEYISYGHPGLEGLINMVSQRGLVARWYLNELRTTTQYLPKKIANKIRFYDCKTKYLLDILERFSYCLFNFKVSYLTDDKREEIRTIVVDRFSAGVNNRLLGLWSSLFIDEECRFKGMGEGEIRPMDEVYQAACDYIKGEISSIVEDMKKGISRRLSKEIRRVENYYSENEAEIKRRLNRESSDERQKRLKQKLKINEIERERKILDLEEKHRLRVNIRLLNAALIYQPKIRCKLEITGRGKSFDFNVFCNPVFKDIEEPFCMRCRSASYDIWFDADSGLVCPACHCNPQVSLG